MGKYFKKIIMLVLWELHMPVDLMSKFSEMSSKYNELSAVEYGSRYPRMELVKFVEDSF